MILGQVGRFMKIRYYLWKLVKMALMDAPKFILATSFILLKACNFFKGFRKWLPTEAPDLRKGLPTKASDRKKRIDN